MEIFLTCDGLSAAPSHYAPHRPPLQPKSAAIRASSTTSASIRWQYSVRFATVRSRRRSSRVAGIARGKKVMHCTGGLLSLAPLEERG